ncbi:MAG TPA: hypothetical protein VLB68_21070 [Pyrinomonadaceae bacterium]|nr:hypothetical protein [Pyrinomonadaceae bacterium]
MSHSKTKKAKSQFRSRRWVAIILATISLVAIAAITVASSQLIASKADARHNSTNSSMPLKVAKQDPQVEGQTGQVRPLTQEEAQRMGEELKSRLNRSTAGLVEQRQPDGSVSMDLQGRFQSVVLARRNEDGSVAKSCVDNPRAAAAFLGIDPKLVGVQSSTGVSKTPIRSAPVKN